VQCLGLIFTMQNNTAVHTFLFYPHALPIRVTEWQSFFVCDYFVGLHALPSRGSSVSIVSDYGLDDQAIGVSSPAGAKDFSSNLCVQTGSEAHPASCTIGTGGPFPGAKRGRGLTLTTNPHLVPRSRMSRSYTSTPPRRLRGV
jgi:hypothetical protein